MNGYAISDWDDKNTKIDCEQGGSDGGLVLIPFAPEQGAKMSHIFCKHQAPKKQQPGTISVAHKLTLHISRFLS